MAPALDMTVGDLIEALEHDIAERQGVLRMLRALSSDMGKGRGRPRAYAKEDHEAVAALIDAGHTHRDIARLLRMPIASVGTLAKRMDAKRRKGDWRGGARKKGHVDRGRKHVAVKRDHEAT